ncbi:UvrD-helicase domain-containing protein [Christensenellaceae bacterium OttesenSCG-928-K19]|nr:UvrD-helicase domain-containing protein [Christensenellaceae bacterium OttesenSCG-928-K19]
MPNLIEQLNEQQKEAVETTEGYVRVVAGAGSGKTRTLVSRYVYLVQELGVSPGRIMSATFTNKAANEMKSRIRKLLGDVDTGFISTFHGFCLQVLKEDIHKLNYPQSFSIMDETDQKSLLEEIYHELGFKLRDFTFRDMLKVIDLFKAPYEYVGQVTEPDEQKAIDYFGSFRRDDRDRILGKYIQKQRRNFMLDFDDIINYTLYLFTHHKDVLQKWQQRLQYIQVDEFQDVDGKQAALVYMLSEGYGNLFVVGDPDQTIYSWRGADVRVILDFDKVFPQAKTIYLHTNYRSTPQILDVANDLISKNKERLPGALRAIREDGPKVFYKHARSTAEEAAYVARTVKFLLTSGVKPYHIAILYRAHYVSRSLEEAFVKEDVPYTLFNGVEFYNRKEIKDVLCYLRMPLAFDDLSFLRTINTPRREIGRTRLAFLTEYAESNNVRLYDALKDNLTHDKFKNTGAKRYVDVIERYAKLLGGMSVSDFADGILRESGYEEMLMKNADQNRIDNVSELKNAIQQYESTAGETVALADYLGKIVLFTNLDVAEKRDSIKLMTVHTAKGLEYPYVFLVSLNEGIFPSSRVRSRQEMEEERRLCYVAFTRARDSLFIVDAEGRNTDSSFRYPSRFIFNVDFDKLEIDGIPDEQFLSQAKAYIGNLESRLHGLALVLHTGDRVIHPVFGRGTIVRETDKSYEIEFENVKGLRDIEKTYGRLKKA